MLQTFPSAPTGRAQDTVGNNPKRVSLLCCLYACKKSLRTNFSTTLRTQNEKIPLI